MTPNANENQAEKHSAEDVIKNLSSYLRSDGAPNSAVEDLEIIYAELSTLRKELEAAKKAQEWLMENGKYILERSGFLNERHENELRELLNNGKDGK